MPGAWWPSSGLVLIIDPEVAVMARFTPFAPIVTLPDFIRVPFCGLPLPNHEGTQAVGRAFSPANSQFSSRTVGRRARGTSGKTLVGLVDLAARRGGGDDACDISEHEATQRTPGRLVLGSYDAASAGPPRSEDAPGVVLFPLLRRDAVADSLWGSCPYAAEWRIVFPLAGKIPRPGWHRRNKRQLWIEAKVPKIEEI